MTSRARSVDSASLPLGTRMHSYPLSRSLNALEVARLHVVLTSLVGASDNATIVAVCAGGAGKIQAPSLAIQVRLRPDSLAV